MRNNPPSLIIAGLLLLFAGPDAALAQEISPRAAEAIYNKTAPALVTVQFVARVPVARFGSMRDVEHKTTGLIVRKDGLVLVAGSRAVDGLLGVGDLASPRNIAVKLADGRLLDAEFVGADEDTLLSFVKITSDPGDSAIPWVEFVDRPVRLGELLVSVAEQPDGYVPRHKLGFSRVAAVVERPSRFIQLADPMPGFTGSPVCTADGKVIGLLGRDPTAAGIGGAGSSFAALALELSPVAIPSARLLPFIESPPQTAEQERGFLGIQMQAFGPELARLWGLEPGGIVVSYLVPGSPAIDAGVKEGDIITHLDGVRVDITEDDEIVIFQHAVRRHPPGATVHLTVMRPLGEPDPATVFEEVAADVTLTHTPRSRLAAATVESPVLGCTVREITLGDRLERRLPADTKGVLVALVVPAGPASIGRLGAGDLIQRADGEPIDDLAAFEAHLERLKARKPAETVFFVQRGTDTAFVQIKLEW